MKDARSYGIAALVVMAIFILTIILSLRAGASYEPPKYDPKASCKAYSSITQDQWERLREEYPNCECARPDDACPPNTNGYTQQQYAAGVCNVLSIYDRSIRPCPNGNYKHLSLEEAKWVYVNAYGYR